jgi:hypothetical protein
MDYEILESISAHELKRSSSALFIMQIEFNFASVYQLSNSSCLVMPLNPFGKSLLVSSLDLLNKFIENKEFPVDDRVNGILKENSAEIDNLVNSKEKLKDDLLEYLFKDAKTSENISVEKIDEIYKLLRKRRKFKILELKFILLIGDFLINQCKEQNYRWGLLEIKQLLNPIKCLVLISTEKENCYFNLEEKIKGKRGYLGANYILKLAENHTRKSNEFERIVKII